MTTMTQIGSSMICMVCVGLIEIYDSEILRDGKLNKKRQKLDDYYSMENKYVFRKQNNTL